MDEGLVLRFSAPDSDLEVVVEDDGRVAYAYIRQAEQVVGDVWLYNVAPTPPESQWGERSQLPFLNPADASVPRGDFRITAATRLDVAWRANSADLFADGEWLATLQVGMKPGLVAIRTRRWTARANGPARAIPRHCAGAAAARSSRTSASARQSNGKRPPETPCSLLLPREAAASRRGERAICVARLG